MTSNGLKCFLVILNRSATEDASQTAINEIQKVDGVLTIVPHVVDGLGEIVEARARHLMIGKLYELLQGAQ